MPGWIPEDDLTPERRREQGWAGMACLARELVSLEYRNVVKALHSSITDIGSFDCEQDSQDTYTVKTVGIRPAQELLKLREGAKAHFVPIHSLRSSSTTLRHPLHSKTWELAFEADILSSCLALNIVIQHSSSKQLPL